MRVGDFLNRLWRRPPTREGRNEQKKATAALANAAAIALFVAGLFGPVINPALASLSALDRMLLILYALVAHIGARTLLWTLEDR